MGENHDTQVWVDAVSLDPRSGRQIDTAESAVSRLAEHSAAIRQAVLEVVNAMPSPADVDETPSSLKVTKLEVSFELRVGVEGGIIVSKASAEAALGVTVELTRA
jgi:hypothetical protein